MPLSELPDPSLVLEEEVVGRRRRMSGSGGGGGGGQCSSESYHYWFGSHQAVAVVGVVGVVVLWAWVSSKYLGAWSCCSS